MAEKRNTRTISQLGYKLAVVCLTERQVRALGMDPEKVTTKDVRKYVWDELGMDKLMEDQLNKERKEKEALAPNKVPKEPKAKKVKKKKE